MTQLAVLANQLHEQAIADFKVSEKFAYSFIMKVKQIRDERLYKELGFTSFDDYCDKAWNTVRRSMDERIQIAESFGQPNFESTYSQLGHSKSLLLAQMEPERRQEIMSNPQQLPSGETITVNEMTVKQLKQLEKEKEAAERRAKEAEQRAEREENEKFYLQKLLNQEKQKPTQVVTQTVEVVPDKVKKQISDLEFQNTNLKAGYQEAKEKLKAHEMRETVDFDEEEARKQREKMQHEADLSVINLRVAFKQFIEKAAITQFLQGAIAFSSQSEKDHLTSMVESSQKIIDQTKAALKGRKLGDINE